MTQDELNLSNALAAQLVSLRAAREQWNSDFTLNALSVHVSGAGIALPVTVLKNSPGVDPVQLVDVTALKVRALSILDEKIAIAEDALAAI